MTSPGWRFSLAATLALLVNYGVSHPAIADAMEITVTSGAEPGTLILFAPAGAKSFTFNPANSALSTMFPELASHSSLTISDNPARGFAFSNLTNRFDFHRNGVDLGAVTYTISATDVNFTVPAGAVKILDTTVSGDFPGITNPLATYSDAGSASGNTPFGVAVSNSKLGFFVPMSLGLNSFLARSVTPVIVSWMTPFAIPDPAAFTTNPLSDTTGSAMTAPAAIAVPEPSSLILGAFALPLLVFLRRRRIG